MWHMRVRWGKKFQMQICYEKMKGDDELEWKFGKFDVAKRVSMLLTTLILSLWLESFYFLSRFDSEKWKIHSILRLHPLIARLLAFPSLPCVCLEGVGIELTCVRREKRVSERKMVEFFSYLAVNTQTMLLKMENASKKISLFSPFLVTLFIVSRLGLYVPVRKGKKVTTSDSIVANIFLLFHWNLCCCSNITTAFFHN